MALAWSAVSTPWDAEGTVQSVIQVGSRIIASSLTLPNAIYTSDDGGATWIPRPSPFDAAGDDLGFVSAFAYSAALDRIVAVGVENTGANNICYSDDHGDTWVGAGTPTHLGFPTSVARDDGQGLFVVGGASLHETIHTSPDGIAWTARTTPFDGNGSTAGFVEGVVWAGGFITHWVAVGFNRTGTKTAMTSGDAIGWTNVATGPFDGGVSPRGACAVAFDGEVLIALSHYTRTPAISTSIDAVTWVGRSSDLDGGQGTGASVAVLGPIALAGNTKGIVESRTGGASWGPASGPLIAVGSGVRGISLAPARAFAVGSGGGSVTAAVAPQEGLIWTGLATPYDAAGGGQLNAVVQVGSRVVVGGESLACLGGAAIYSSDDGGATWDARSSPFDAFGCGGSVSAFAYSAALDRIVAVGNPGDIGGDFIAYSDDHGDTWVGTASGGGLGDYPNCVARDDDSGMFVVGTATSVHAIYTSPDGIAWTGRTTPWDGAGTAQGVCFASGPGKWVAVGVGSASGASAMTATDPTGTWAEVAAGPFDGLGGFGSLSVASSGAVIVAGGGGQSPGISVSTDAVTWTGAATDLDGGTVKAAAFFGSLILVGGKNGVVQSSDGGATWLFDTSFPIFPSSNDYSGCNALSINADSGAAFGVGDNDASSIFAASAQVAVPPPTPAVGRFFEGYPWRFAILRTSDLATVGFLDHWATGRRIEYELDVPTKIQCVVPADSPEVWLPDPDDGDPIVAEGTRILLALRREAPGGSRPPYVPRAAGVIAQPTDNAEGHSGAGNAYTTIVAYDGLQTLYQRPVRHPNDGSLLGIDGLRYPVGTNPVDIIVGQITLTESYDGPTLIDYTGGHFDPAIPNLTHEVTFEHGSSVGELVKKMCDDGYVDLRLDTIYDTANTKMWRLNLYLQLGADKYEAQFAWNLPGRSLVGISRLKDGLERGNKVQFYNGQGGPAVTLQIDAASVTKYGPYWYQAFFPTETVAFQVEARAAAELAARKDGLFTITGNPAPERSPVPLLEYAIGDNVVVAASAAGFRETMIGLWRVTKIPIALTDDGIETVEQLEVSTTLPPVGP